MKQMVDDNSLPLYIRLKEAILHDILDGTLKAGERLPSERELCQMHGVSRITVRQAVAELANEGFVRRTHGKGTYVLERKVEQELFSTVTPFESSLLSKGIKPSTRLLESRVRENTYQLSKKLNAPISQSIVEITLLGFGDGIPIAFYTSYFTCDLGMKMQEFAVQLHESEKPFTTRDLYQYIPEIKIGAIHQNFEASIADKYISDKIGIKKGAPILIVKSTVFSNNDEPLEYKIAIYRGDKYNFNIVRRF